jgi:pimeloyl-ACP methyl ester carboxylesterase
MTATEVKGRARGLAGLGVEDHGATDDRPPLVLLHGLTFNRTMWGPALAALRDVDPGRRVLAIDLPGHGGSSPWPSYDVESVAEAVHRAVTEAGLERPVVVGHSLAAVIATVYGARYPTRGVVNVDQPLQTEGFIRFVRSLADRLRGPEFPDVWQMFVASMHMELLPPEGQELLRSMMDARQELVLGYWREVLERPVEEIAAAGTVGLAALREADVPYLVVAGQELEPGYARWLEAALPQARVEVVAGSGHFPHIAHPDTFAELLALTGRERWL